jgi:hypothetical protein
MSAPHPSTPDEVIVRWPGGLEKTYQIPSSAKEVIVNADGTIAATE